MSEIDGAQGKNALNQGQSEKKRIKQEKQNIFTGVAIVVCKTQSSQRRILKNNSSNHLRRISNGLFPCIFKSQGTEVMEFQRAPEPTDIFWENMNVKMT
jgi:Cytosolic domain of 10TM putative phosphate transporter